VNYVRTNLEALRALALEQGRTLARPINGHAVQCSCTGIFAVDCDGAELSGLSLTEAQLACAVTPEETL
jgi:hypothetical protein